MKGTFILIIMIWTSYIIYGQMDTIILGYGNNSSQDIVITSSGGPESMPENTINQSGFLPNDNAASKFLSQATLGYSKTEIDMLTSMGIEDWLEAQWTKPQAFSIVGKIREYHKIVKDSTNNQTTGAGNRLWDYAWWQYLMTSDDALRQRVAFALSELIVVSEVSGFNNVAYAMGQFYDILLNNAFGNYRELLGEVTLSPAMGTYLTYLNNPKSNPALNQFPDENYAREIMQLFTLGTVLLEENGTVILDENEVPVPTYDNEDIIEFSKVFTGLTWADRTQFNRGALNDTSYIADMVMWNSFHEPGEKHLLNDFVIPNRNPVDGIADINDALDNLFLHQNTPPFVCKFLIKRLVTSNPSPGYIERIVQIFKDDGNGVRGNLKAVVKAILLDPEALQCEQSMPEHFGMLKEPMIRYIHINKALNANTQSGNFRNDMNYVYLYTGQRPLTSPSVFNFFQQDYQPIGPIEIAGLDAPEFQITDAQTIAGFINGLYRWIMSGDLADEYDLFTNEADAGYSDEITTMDISEEMSNISNDRLHILLDRINLLFAHGRIEDNTIEILRNVLVQMPESTDAEKVEKARLAIYLMLTTPEYLINK